MKKLISILLLIFLSIVHKSEAQLPIIPYPNKVETGKGFFKLTKSAASTAKLIVDPQTAVVASMEGYHLSVTPSAITITAKTKINTYTASYKTGFNGVFTTSPTVAPGHQVSQSACWLWFSGVFNTVSISI